MQAASSGLLSSCSSRGSCRSPGTKWGRNASGQHHALMHVPSNRRLQRAQYKAVDLQDGVLPQQQTSSRVQSPLLDQQDVAIPAPSNMQAQVMLVPKKGASTALLRQKPAAEDPLGKFLLKCKLAWNLFFPPQHEEGLAAAATPKLSPKDLGKQRLQMILVADRCGLSPNSLVEMKKNTLAALADCMDLEDLQDAHLRFTMTREGGTTYSMAVPILRPGPYAEDGSVVGQDAKRAAAAAAAAGPVGAMMAAAAAAAGDTPGWESDSDEDYEHDLYRDDMVSEGDDADSPVIDAVFTDAADTAEHLNMAPAAELQMQPPLVPDDSSAGAVLEPDALAVAAAADAAEAASGDESDTEVFREQFRELLVEELVHDVGEVVQHTTAADLSDTTTVVEASAELGAAGCADAGDMGVVTGNRSSSSSPVVGLSEHELREVAAKEVQRLVEGNHVDKH